MLDITADMNLIYKDIGTVNSRRIPGFYSLEESNFYGYLVAIKEMNKLELASYTNRDKVIDYNISDKATYKHLVENLLNVMITESDNSKALLYMEKFSKIHYFMEPDIDMYHSNKYSPWRSYFYLAQL
ncbi:hypothetical protein [Photobacterium damselae]|uniref:hypothetical protein n=1 Tax=Photobacterium damselae TaxID=38293 RepID=UPI001F27FA3C|nr:hypothetical protein [Photobacterium damselae]UKA03962.1 hypothetical protein IHC89_15650 [Photobacterium damselae subsp. damselae]